MPSKEAHVKGFQRGIVRIVSDIPKNMSIPKEFWRKIQQETETKFWIPEFAYLNVIMDFRTNFPTPFFLNPDAG